MSQPTTQGSCEFEWLNVTKAERDGGYDMSANSCVVANMTKDANLLVSVLPQWKSKFGI